MSVVYTEKIARERPWRHIDTVLRANHTKGDIVTGEKSSMMKHNKKSKFEFKISKRSVIRPLRHLDIADDVTDSEVSEDSQRVKRARQNGEPTVRLDVNWHEKNGDTIIGDKSSILKNNENSTFTITIGKRAIRPTDVAGDVTVSETTRSKRETITNSYNTQIRNNENVDVVVDHLIPDGDVHGRGNVLVTDSRNSKIEIATKRMKRDVDAKSPARVSRRAGDRIDGNFNLVITHNNNSNVNVSIKPKRCEKPRRVQKSRSNTCSFQCFETSSRQQCTRGTGSRLCRVRYLPTER